MPVPRLIRSALPIALVAAGAAGAVLFSRRTPSPVPVVIGGDYYVYPSIVEAAPKMSDGTDWDRIDSSAPDLFVDITWRGTRIYRSDIRDDVLLGKWSLGELNLGKIALGGGKPSVDDVIHAARVNIARGDELTITVADDDTVGSDVICELRIPADRFVTGENVFVDPCPGLERMVLKVLALNEAHDITE